MMGTLFTVQKALPLLNDGGSITPNGSVASMKGRLASRQSTEVIAWMVSTIPMGEPKEVAKVALFLASDGNQ
jgi:hypothetical protein